MKSGLLTFLGLALAVVTWPLSAQTAPSTNAPAATTPVYPVVMPATPPANTAPVDATPEPNAAINPTVTPVVPQLVPGTQNPSPLNPQALPGMTQNQPQAAKENDIQDIRPPFFFMRSWFRVWVSLAVIAAVALLIALWFLFKPHRQLSAKTAYELTLEKLEKARGMLREDNAMPYAILVSETIRSYLGQRFLSPSTRRTTDEFLRLMDTDEAAPMAGHRDLLRHFLQSCDLVKFARYQPTLAELEEVQQRAITFVSATKPVTVQRKEALV